VTPRDRRLVLAALEGLLPPGWRAMDTGGTPAGVALVPPTGMARTGPVLPWPGPHRMPRGLSLCRILVTAGSARPFWAPVERVVLVTGLPGDRRMRRLAGGFVGRGWPAAVAQVCAQAAQALHDGQSCKA